MRIFILITVALMSCQWASRDEVQQSNSGVKQIRPPELNTADGISVEQKNIQKRLERDSRPGSIKWIYGVQFGQIIFRASVVGKVTSSGKRLEPTTVTSADGTDVNIEYSGMPVNVGGRSRYTSEVIQADGTFGSSDSYVYWFDEYDRYWQWNGDYIISDTPIKVSSAILNFRDVDEEEATYARELQNKGK